MADDATTPRSDLFAFADRYVEQRAARDPMLATALGVEGFDHLLPSFTSERWADDAAFTAASLAKLRAIEPIDDIDRIARSVMEERLDVVAELERTGEFARRFGTISSPASEIRQVFELMRRETDEDRAVITARLRAVPGALESWRAGLADVTARGELPARRHVLGVADQASTYARGAYEGFVAGLYAPAAPPSDALDAARDADAACGALAAHLTEDVAPAATGDEACGPVRYPVWLRYYNGAVLDLDELYAWAWSDLRRINERMWELAATLAPGAARLSDVAAALDADDDRAILGTDALLERLESFTQATIEALDGVHFDIDPRIRRCDARLAPEGSAAAPYYWGPSEDLSRPGTTWFPTLGRTRFPWWRSASTWYHESVPGHHLQDATSLISGDRLSRFQRTLAWTSGYGEGWALYAERLMEELGGFTDPGDELGYLEGQALRAARIVVDLGLHLGYPAPKDVGEIGTLGDRASKPWTPPMAVALLEERAIQDHEFAVSEVDRYLAIPAQATSYKIGERAWLAAREEARRRLDGRFDLKDFHAFALRLGPMGLDPFRDEVARWDGG
ncbi:MAG TPA: DUF885 domain-containing protein [Acidimicrobiales bacterium]|jgi:uncharacterized protein (DUF885 family)|nr:DUF885 domain-containing protein [Acidimicrobiales bacterium]